MKTQGIILLVVVFVAVSSSWAAAPRVGSTSPDRNEANVGINDDISVTFLSPASAKSVNTNSFIVHGSQRGLYGGTFSWSSALHFVFHPDSRFLCGEVVTVTLTTDIVSPTQEPMLKPYQFQFTVGVATSTGHLIWDGDYGLPFGAMNLYPADLDKDSDIDLAVACFGDNSISVMLNDGDGGFSFDTSYEASSHPQDVVAGDFDNDGFIDLVAAIQDSDSILVLINDGTGRFDELGRYASGTGCLAVTLFDFNGDGFLDVASANYDADTVTVLANMGGAELQEAWSFATALGPSCAVGGDFDGNHLIDLATATRFGPTLETWLNDNGVLVADSAYGIDYQAWRMVSADFNADQELDVATVSWSDCISVLLNNGDGTFAMHQTDSVYDYPRYMAVGDIEGDGDPDIVVSTHGSNEVVVMTNEGGGNFTVDSAYATSGKMQGIAMADFNRDGILDVAAIDWTNTSLEVFVGTDSDDCCLARGDLDRSGGPADISDLIWMVEWVFLGGVEPPCMEEADVNASGGIPDISDVVHIVDYMFLGGAAPAPCP
mgnify:CR=1 FL=1